MISGRSLLLLAALTSVIPLQPANLRAQTANGCTEFTLAATPPVQETQREKMNAWTVIFLPAA
jgi:hypothetical protein